MIRSCSRLSHWRCNEDCCASPAKQVQLKLGFEEVERLRLLLAAPGGSRCELPAGWEARKQRSRSESSLQIFRSGTDSRDDGPDSEPCASAYEYRLRVPGELEIPEARRLIKVSLVQVERGLDRGKPAGPETDWDASLRSGIGVPATATTLWAMSARKR